MCVCVCVCASPTSALSNQFQLFVCCLFRKSLLWTVQQKTALFFLESVTVNTVVHTESEACQKQCCHNVFILLSLSGVTNLSLLVGVCEACMLACRCLQMTWWAAVTVVAIPSQKALLMCPYVSSGKFSVLASRCSRALLHNLQLTSDRYLIFASHLATGMIPRIVIISCLLCLQGTRGSFKYF